MCQGLGITLGGTQTYLCVAVGLEIFQECLLAAYEVSMIYYRARIRLSAGLSTVSRGQAIRLPSFGESSGQPSLRLKADYVRAPAAFLVSWARQGSLWPLSFGLACCAIEMMHATVSRYDFDRFGVIFRATPRQADLIIVAGTLTTKMAPALRRLYEQMADPK